MFIQLLNMWSLQASHIDIKQPSGHQIFLPYSLLNVKPIIKHFIYSYECFISILFHFCHIQQPTFNSVILFHSPRLFFYHMLSLNQYMSNTCSFSHSKAKIWCAYPQSSIKPLTISWILHLISSLYFLKYILEI